MRNFLPQIRFSSFDWIIGRSGQIRKFLTPKSCCNTFTFSADPSSGFVYICEHFKFMPSNAMSFSSIDGSTSNSSQYILLSRDYLKMIWINALCISTDVIYDLIARDFPIVKLIRKSMSKFSFPSFPNRKVAISIRSNGTLPNPARLRFMDFLKKSFFDSFKFNSHATVIVCGVSTVNRGCA